MGLALFLVGIEGIAGAIELDRSPVAAIVLTVVGLALFFKDYRVFLRRNRKRW